ncbi:MAG: UDP-4-amino-4,6-dideoxy-N-acetyl-beta-L-altrosamine transaminase [Salibacteraceae bacterium]|jgi:UDP-4-amino-4,6-dideoxy-N-acetyl-beta-L-altrosamine transaminase
MKHHIPYGRQNITQKDIDAVVETLKGDFLTQGPRIKEFENNFAKYVGAKYAVAVSNGTAALHICTMSLGVKPGQKVITTPITFVATANAIRYCGGEVVFADIDPNTYLLDINAVKKILKSEPAGTFSGIMPVDFTGRPVNMEDFRKLADEYGLWIIEDAAHSPGGFFADEKNHLQTCGNGKFADLAIFSFHPVKHIASGEGGMVTTNNQELYKKLCSFRSHGIAFGDDNLINSVETAFMDALPKEYPQKYPLWYMEMQELGYNYRITDIQAALGSSQLGRAEEGLAKRREIAQTYFNAFENEAFILGQSGVIEGHAYHLYVIEVPKRAELHKHLREKGIFSQIHYIPSHLMPYYQKQGWKLGDLPNAEKYYKHCISLPMFPTLKAEEQQFVIDTIVNFYS